MSAADWTTSFTTAIDTMDIEQLLPFFREDAVFTYGNNPPMEGHDGIRVGIGYFFQGIAGISHTVPNVVEGDGGELVVEFLTTYTRHDGNAVTLPGIGAFDFDDAHLIRDYRVYADVTPVFAP